MGNGRQHKRRPGMLGNEHRVSPESILFGAVILLTVISFLSLSLDENHQVFVIVAVAAIAILFVLGLILFNRRKRKQARKKFEDAKIDRMLSKPLATFGKEEDEATKLAKLYENDK